MHFVGRLSVMSGHFNSRTLNSFVLSDFKVFYFLHQQFYQQSGQFWSLFYLRSCTLSRSQHLLFLENGQNIKSCQTYKFLGTQISDSGILDLAIKDRNIKSWKALSMLNSILWDQKITRHDKYLRQQRWTYEEEQREIQKWKKSSTNTFKEWRNYDCLIKYLLGPLQEDRRQEEKRHWQRNESED